MPNLTRAQVRDIDRLAVEEFGVPSIVLMENAGRGAAELLLSLGARGRVVVCCGKGNNGGDGFVIARHLNLHSQVNVHVLLFALPEELSVDAAINYRIIDSCQIPIIPCSPSHHDLAGREDVAAADWIVDALFGIGLAGPVRSPFDRVIDSINGLGKPVLAVDIPSGLDCDTGLPLGPTVRATHTATFVAPKVGFANSAAAPWLGTVHVVGIGAPRALLKRFGL